MPESVHDNESELRNIPEHSAEKAATHNLNSTHDHAPNETKPDEPTSAALKEATTLHHGHAASIAAEKARK